MGKGKGSWPKPPKAPLGSRLVEAESADVIRDRRRYSMDPFWRLNDLVRSLAFFAGEVKTGNLTSEVGDNQVKLAERQQQILGECKARKFAQTDLDRAQQQYEVPIEFWVKL